MDIKLKCQCGAFRGVATDIAPEKANRVVCYCADCQGFAHFLGKASTVLDSNGGTDIFSVAPCNLKFTQGSEHLRCMRLSEAGLCRWYTACCNSPIANTMHFASMPFAGVIHSIMEPIGGQSRDEMLGPIRGRIFSKSGIGSLPADARPSPPLPMMLRVLCFLFVGFVAGRHSPSPFFDPVTRKLSVEPKILSQAERDALRPLCGPRP